MGWRRPDGGGQGDRDGQHGAGRGRRTWSDHAGSTGDNPPAGVTHRGGGRLGAAPTPGQPRRRFGSMRRTGRRSKTGAAGMGWMPMPAVTASVVAFLTEGAATLSAGTLTRRAAAIAAKHRQSGVASPAADPAVTAILRQAHGSATPRRAPRKTPATLIRMAVRCPRDLAGMRDRALLLLAASGLGRAALVGLDVEHIRFTRTAAELFPDAVSAVSQAVEDGQGGCGDRRPQPRPGLLPGSGAA